MTHAPLARVARSRRPASRRTTPRFREVTGAARLLARSWTSTRTRARSTAPGEDALYFTTLPRVRREAGLDVPLVDIRKVVLDGYRFPVERERRLGRPPAGTDAANGMTVAGRRAARLRAGQR